MSNYTNSVPVQSTQPSPQKPDSKLVSIQTKNIQFLLCVFIGIIFLVIGSMGGYYLAINQLPPSVIDTCPEVSSSVGVTCPNCELAPSPTATPKPLPKITNRIQSNKDYSSWSIYKDTRGYTFNYPQNWFLSARNGNAYSIQNWDPDIVRNGPPLLSGNDSKWDINFDEHNIQNISDVLIKDTGDIRIDLIEKSKTIHGLDIYIIQGTSSLFGDENTRIQVITAIVLNNDKYFSWHSIYAGIDNAKILKQIVESIGLNQ